MKIRSSNINFKAIPVGTARIYRRDNSSGELVKNTATFVLIDEDNQNDFDAIRKLSSSWENAQLIKYIQSDVNWFDLNRYRHWKIYALTTQTDHFEQLNEDKIIALADTRLKENCRNIKVRYLQVSPDSINIDNADNPKYEGVGTAVIKSLKKMYNNITLKALNSEEIFRFYLHNGFQKIKGTHAEFEWNANIFTVLLRTLKEFFSKI